MKINTTIQGQNKERELIILCAHIHQKITIIEKQISQKTNGTEK